MSSVLLTQAVSSGDKGAVSALLANGANVNERTNGGQTPLILATIFGHTHLLPLLLEAGADPHLRDNLGLNAIDWAQRRGATEAIQLFDGYDPSARAATQFTKRPEPAAQPPAPAASERARPVSEGEKSQRWLSGLKQRIAEQPQTEAPDGTNIFRAQPEPPISQPEPQLPKIEEPEPAPAVVETTAAAPENPKQNPGPKTTRKRCPKCGEIYNSEFVTYCAHHVIKLVDVDEAPIISEPPKSSPVLFWMIIGITLLGSLVIGTVITKYFFNSNSVTPQTASGPTASPAARAVQRGVPSVADRDLERKATSLPIAECPLNGQEPIPGTVVVRVVINKDGRVTSARASGGDWLLRSAASEAAMKSTFSPEKLRGRETEGTITYTFEP